jgi:AcrR family transcriptional regulator
MTDPAAESKPPRRYDSSGRRARAQAQLEVTLDHARALFLDRGYVTTTVDAIAEAAGVSAATIYKTYGGKAGLVRSLCRAAMDGDGPVPAHDRSDAMRIGVDGRTVVAGWAALLSEVSPRISPLLLLLKAAAESDDEARALLDEQEAQRLERMRGNARFLADAGHLRRNVAVEEAGDVLWLCSSPELYELLVMRRGWDAARLGRFAAETMTSALL